MYIILLNQNSNKWFTWLVYSIGEDIICFQSQVQISLPFQYLWKKKKEKLTKLNYKVFDRHHTLIPNVLTNQTQGPHFVS